MQAPIVPFLEGPGQTSHGWGTPDVCTEHFRTRETKVKSLLRLFVFCWSPRHISAAGPAELWGEGWGVSHPSQVQPFNLIVINKQPLTSWVKLPETLWTHGYTDALYTNVSCFDTESVSGRSFNLTKQLRLIADLP